MIKILLKKIDKLIDLMLKDQEDRKLEREKLNQEKRDEELRSYATKHIRNEPHPMISSVEDPNRPVRTSADICIPYNLTTDEKLILEDFYNK